MAGESHRRDHREVSDGINRILSIIRSILYRVQLLVRLRSLAGEVLADTVGAPPGECGIAESDDSAGEAKAGETSRDKPVLQSRRKRDTISGKATPEGGCCLS